MDSAEALAATEVIAGAMIGSISPPQLSKRRGTTRGGARAVGRRPAPPSPPPTRLSQHSRIPGSRPPVPETETGHHGR